MIRLSVVIITLNEEKKICQCLDSVAPVADEVVVVDSGSTDATVAMCRSKGARVITHAFEGYVEQVRFAVQQASHPHVLSIDADEYLSPELQQSILTVKNQFSADGYSFNRLNIYRGRPVRHGGWYPDRKVRLWRTDRGAFGGTNPHNAVVMRPGSRIQWLRGDLVHCSYESVEEHVRQASRFTKIAIRELHARGARVSRCSVFLRPCVRFFRDYLLRLGFLDGRDGFTIAVISALANYLKYAGLYRLNHEHTH